MDQTFPPTRTHRQLQIPIKNIQKNTIRKFALEVEYSALPIKTDLTMPLQYSASVNS